MVGVWQSVTQRDAKKHKNKVKSILHKLITLLVSLNAEIKFNFSFIFDVAPRMETDA